MRPLLSFVIVAILLVLSSCHEKEQPVSKDEALVMARTIDSAIANENVTLFGSLVSVDILVKRMAASGDIGNTNEFKQGLQAGLQRSELGQQIVAGLKEGGSYELFKHYERNNVHHLLYRFSGGGLNYHDFELTKVNDKIYVADIFLYTSGENLSKSMSDLVLMAKADGTMFNNTQIESFNRMKALAAEGKYEEAKMLFDAMPETLKNHKFLQIFYLNLASGLGDEEYKTVMRQFEIRYRHEPNMYLSLIDAYMLQKDYDRALDAVTKIDSMVGNDPYLDLYRYIFYSQSGRDEQATISLEQLYKGMPHNSEGALLLIANYLGDKKYDKARTVIAAFRKNPKMDQEQLEETLNLYPLFEAEE